MTADQSSSRGQVARDVVMSILAMASVGIGVTLLSEEARVNPNLETWGQATWFALNMVTNVAYLDFQPVTTGGRVLAGILQVCGIAFIGIFTASLAGAIIRDEPGRK